MKKLLLFAIALLSLSFGFHKYYVSITKVEIDSESKLLKIYTKVFVDDFEKVMNERYELEIKDYSNLEFSAEESITSYLKNRIQFKANRTPLSLKFLGTELEGEMLYLYYEVPFPNKVQRLDIYNTLFQDFFSEQINNVDVSYKNQVKSLSLLKDATSGTLYFN